MGSTSPPIVTYDYQFAPNAQKARNLLNASNIPFKICEQPFMQPRPILTDLGVTYRRIPVNAIGKDLYCDNRPFYEAIQRLFPGQTPHAGPADHAYESFGYRTFWICLPLVPAELLNEQMSKDRFDLYHVFSRKDFAELRPNSLAEFKHFLDIVETEFLSQSRFVEGHEVLGIADLHAMWMIKWALQTLDVGGKEKGFSRDDFPKVWAWIDAVRVHTPENEPDKLEAKAAADVILGSDYTAPDIGVDTSVDPLGASFKKGDSVTVETNDDDEKSNRLQPGKLVGLSRREIVIELPNSLRLHFPRIGYVLKHAKN